MGAGDRVGRFHRSSFIHWSRRADVSDRSRLGVYLCAEKVIARLEGAVGKRTAGKQKFRELVVGRIDWGED
jgi:hypothetical protein